MSSDSMEPASSTGRTGSVAVRADGLGKLFHIGRTEGMFRYRSLREDLVDRLRRRSAKSSERTLWALRDVSFEISEGETVGIIGRNGAGKSTLFKVLAEITPPTEGRAEVKGRVGSLLEIGMGFHPELTGRENVFLSGAVLGMRRAEVVRKFDEIVEFAGVDKFLETPVKRYSTGMYLRLAFAVAAHLEPTVLLIDEVLAVGDARFQEKCLGRMAELGASGRTVLFVSHSMPTVVRLCPRVILLDEGKLVADGPGTEVVRIYLDSGLGTSAERVWASTSEAPGDSLVRIKSVRILTENGVVSDEIDIGRPTAIEVEYWQLAEEPTARPSANLHLYNEDGVCLFVSCDFNNKEWWQKPRTRGLVKSTCHFPGNFFAEGKVFVHAGVSTFNPTMVHAFVQEAVAFEVIDRTRGEGVRGEYAQDWPGVVRPMLEWTVVTEVSHVAP